MFFNGKEKQYVNGKAQADMSVSARVEEPQVTAVQVASDSIKGTTAELARFMPAMNIDQAVQRRQLIVDYTRQAMVEGTDYGKIPNAGDRLVLFQAGADKLCNWFGLRISYEIVEMVKDWTGADHNGEPFFYYEVRATGFRNDYLIGEGVGSCTSWESKYRWRRCERTCPNCGKENIRKSREGGWYCWAKTGGCGATFPAGDQSIESQETGRKPNPDIFDHVNTIEKMAFKRAKVSCTINCLSASEFTQDMEDFGGEEPPSIPTIVQQAQKINTGGHPIGSQAAADYVAQQKINAAKAAAPAPPTKTGDAGSVPPRPPATATAAAPPSQKPWTNRGEMRRAFERLREIVGESAYLSEMATAGVKDPSEFRKGDAAEASYFRLLAIADKEAA